VDPHLLRKKNVPISYSTMRSTNLSYLKDLGLFGTHSLRRGGATSAANNRENDRLMTEAWRMEICWRKRRLRGRQPK